ncbi:hypothetical protein BC829DRAFT_424089 [Chytridium lagenaria]|nr:hypothetical protein BC829DRAFT_424089 [Chytridium lagenaria]
MDTFAVESHLVAFVDEPALLRSRPCYSLGTPVWFGHSVTAKHRSRSNYSFARFIPVWFGHSITAKNPFVYQDLTIRLRDLFRYGSVRKIGSQSLCSIGLSSGQITTNAFFYLKNIKPSIRHSQYRYSNALFCVRKIQPALFVQIAHSAWSIRHDEASVIWSQYFLVYYVELSLYKSLFLINTQEIGCPLNISRKKQRAQDVRTVTIAHKLHRYLYEFLHSCSNPGLVDDNPNREKRNYFLVVLSTYLERSNVGFFVFDTIRFVPWINYRND